nr:unnamed protein product [Digitaria exilis]
MQGSSSSSFAMPSLLPPTIPSGAGGSPGRRIVVAHRLPLLATPDKNSPFGFAFSLDADAIPLQLSRGFTSPVTYIGTLPSPAQSELVASDELDAYLMDTFNCLPVHLAGDRHAMFYHGFCKHYLWPLLHYMQPPAFMASSSTTAAAAAFIAANRQFADRIIEVISPDDGDLVVVHDYHLIVLPTFLRRKCPHAGVGIFLHSPFPPDEIFTSAAAAGVGDELLRGLLNADLVGFHTVDYARNFISCCARLVGIRSAAAVHGGGGGHLGFNYHGRNVIVKVFAVGIDLSHLRATLASPEAAAKAKEIADEYRGRVLIVGVDDVDVFKGVKLKLLAMEKFFEKNRTFRGKVVLVQINNPARSHGADIDAIRDEMEKIAHRITRRFAGDEEEEGAAAAAPDILVRIIDGPVPMHEKVAYYAAADCCVITSVRDGLNRIPYYYTACRDEFAGVVPSSGDVVPGGAGRRRSNKTSAVVLSEFAGSSACLGDGVIRVNPWSTDAIADAMHGAITMAGEDKLARHRSNYRYLREHDAATWAPAFDGTLRFACRDHVVMTFVGLGFGMSFRAIAVRPEFQPLVHRREEDEQGGVLRGRA